MKNCKLMSLKYLFISSVIFSFVVSNTSFAFKTETEHPEFTRIVEDQFNNIFQVASVRYAPRSGEEKFYVDLVGAVHIGEQQYYQTLNQMFKQYDAVLYEAIMPENANIPAGGYQEKSGLSALQNGLASSMGLTFQMDEVDYTGKQFVHADFTPTEFKQSMDAKGESFFGMFFKLWREGLVQQLSGQPQPITYFDLFSAMMATDRQDAFRKLMALVLLDMESLKVLEGSEGSTIISARNDKALRVLSKVMSDEKNKSVAIFYGAGHFPDFHDKLITKYDLVPISTQWLDAWSFK